MKRLLTKIKIFYWRCRYGRLKAEVIDVHKGSPYEIILRTQKDKIVGWWCSGWWDVTLPIRGENLHFSELHFEFDKRGLL